MTVRVGGRPPRARAVWWATGTAAVVALLLTIAVWTPLVGFLAGVTATTVGLVPLPVLSVTLVTVIGSSVVLALLVLAATRRRGGGAWTIGVVAMIVAVGVALWPLVAVVIGSADRAGDAWSVLSDLWQQRPGA